MSKIFTDYNIGDDLTANDANKSFVDMNNIVVRAGNNIGTALSDSDNYALNDGTNAFATSRSNAFDVSGTNNAIILTTSNTFNHAPIRSYFAGLKVGFFTSATNTGPTTINIDSLGVKNVKTIAGIDFTGGELNSYVELIYNGNNFVLLNQKTQSQYIPNGILLSNNPTNPNTQIDFSAGNFPFSDKSGFANFTAQTGDLSLNFGTGLGMLDIGTKANSTRYYCYAIYNPTTNVSKVLCSTASPSSTGAYTGSNMPSGYTKNKYIGMLITNGNGNIILFTHSKNNYFEYITPIIDFSGSLTTNRVPRPLTLKPNSMAVINVVFFSTLPGGIISSLYLSDMNKVDNTIERLSANIQYKTSGEFQIQTNSSSQIGTRVSNANNTVEISTIGYYDLDI